FWWDRARNVGSTLHEIYARDYLWFGTAALLILTPLAVTSTNGMIRRLGPTRWKALHRLAYVAAIAGAIHYCMVGKFVMTQAIVFAVVLGVLLLYRLIAMHVTLRLSYNKLKAAPRSIAPAAKPKFWHGQLRLAGIFSETPDVRTFRLVPTTGADLPFDYLPGQYLNLTLPIDGQTIRRSYTLASSPTRRGYCELTIKRESLGLSSRHLHDVLKPGALLDVAAPAGKFTFTGEEADGIVLIGGGVGITPLMSKVRYLTDLCWAGDIRLICVVRTEADIIFRTELEDLQRRHPNFHLSIFLTRGADPAWRGEQGRLTAEALRRIVPDIAARTVHICGPDAMAADTRAILATLGVAPDRIKFESFTPAAGSGQPVLDIPPATGEPVAGATLRFARSGREVETDPEKSVLELAEDAGIDIAYDCRSGICGTCKVQLLAGEVRMVAQDALTQQDRQNRLILACQSRCLGDVTVDV
ncbi:MAG: FAD-binding oxidoreductase, partial [Tepidisphaeraceae bacterium]